MNEILGASVAIRVPGYDTDEAGIVVIQRDNRPGIAFPGLWEVPGGTRDPGESAWECGAREVKEEVGIDLSIDNLVWQAAYPSDQVPGMFNAFFVAELSEVPRLTKGDEGRTCGIFSRSEFILGGSTIIRDHVYRYFDYEQGKNGIYVRPSVLGIIGTERQHRIA